MNYKNKLFLEDELRGEDFENIVFTSCKFKGANLKFTNFSKCKFESCDFSGGLFDLTSFSDCKFSGSNLSGIDFSEIGIKNCDFSNALIANGIFQKLKSGSKFERKSFDLTGCVFESASLEGAIFVFCDLSKVNFRNSNLKKTVFDKCKLVETDFSGADIEGFGVETSEVKSAVLDISGFIKFGNSKGFILK